MIAGDEFHFEALLTQGPFSRHAVEADAGKVDGDFRFIEAADDFSVDDFPSKNGQSGNRTDGIPHRPGQFEGPADETGAFQSQLLAGAVQGSQEPVMGARRLDDSHRRGDAVRQGKVLAAVQHRRLGQGTGHLMGALGDAVGTAGQGFCRQIPVEAQMGAMSFVDEDIQALFMSIGCQGLQVAGDAIVGRIGEDDGFRPGMGCNGFLQAVQVRSQRHLPDRIEAAFQVDRDGAAQGQAIDDALMGLAGNEDFIAIAADSQDHGFDTGRRAVDGKESPPGAIEVSCQVHGFLQGSFRLE